MANLWSGRFDEEPDPDVFAFGASFGFDRRLFEDDIRGSVAWAEALEHAGALSAADADRIRRALADILDRGRQDPAFLTGEDEDVHAFVERQLVERLGDTGKRLHTGRSRNEQVSLDLRLYLKRRVPILQLALADLIAALADQAVAAGDAVMPGYTHLRRAQPVLIAHFLLSHAAAFRRDHARLAGAIGEADVLPLGSGALAGTNYPIDPARLAARLGFSRVVSNSIDAASDRDFVATVLHGCALAMVHLSRLAEDLILFTSEEFGFFELSDAVATGSSLMPQKKNPDPLELVRGKTGRVIGHAVGVLIALKGLPTGYNKDLQEDKEALFDAEETLLRSLRAVATVVATLRMNLPRAAAAASGFLLATELADHLVERGLPFRRAHELVGAMVRQLLRDDRTFESLSLSEWRTFSPHFDEATADLIRPDRSVAAKRTPQSTAPPAVAAALNELKGWLESVRAGA